MLAWVGGFIPLLQANLSVVVAAVFLYLPATLLHRRGEDTLAYGLTARPRGRNLALFLLVSALVFPPYAVGFHVWQTELFGTRLDPSADHYLRFGPDSRSLSVLDTTWEGRPTAPVAKGAARLFVDHDRVVLEWGPPAPAGEGAGPFAARLETDGRLELLAGTRHVATAGPGAWLIRPSPASSHVAFRIQGGESFTLDPRRGGRALPRELMLLGPSESPAEARPVRGTRSWSWIVWLVLTQLLLIAIPEEFFYRGYIQGTLDRVWTRRIRLLGVEVGPSVLVVSVLFALGHFLVGFDPQRLGVFFPALLFGWMRCATGSIGAAALFHAASNVVVDLLSKSYVY